MANELAALSGEIARVDSELTRLSELRARLASTRQALEHVAQKLKLPELGAIPDVRTHGRYGPRGSLREWVRELLQANAPAAVDTPTMVRLAEAAFALNLQTSVQRDQFRKNSLTRALRALLAEGLVERIHEPKATGGAVGVWRWKQRDTFAAIAGHELTEEVQPWR